MTELITGVDLVEQMIRVAYGEKLEMAQDDVKLNGWAIESRIYAEDPFRNFLPSIGRLVNYMPPEEGTVDGLTIRNDTGVVSGSEISMFYDPMIAKLCTHAATRDEAIAHMSTALDAFVVDGIEHNVPFLAALMDHPRWKAGNLTTAFIDEEYPDGFEGVSLNEESEKALAAVALSMELVRKNRLDDFIDRMAPHSGETKQEWVVALSKENRVAVNFVAGMPSTPIEMDMQYEDGTSVAVVSDWVPGAKLWTGTVGGKKLTVQIRTGLNAYKLTHSGVQVDAKVMRPNVAAMEALMPVRIPPDTSNLLLCPMPGLVVSIAVQEGQQVQAGEALATVEAMKMENILRAERDLTVSKINAEPGDSLAVDAVIMEFASGDDA